MGQQGAGQPAVDKEDEEEVANAGKLNAAPSVRLQGLCESPKLLPRGMTE